MRYFIQERPNMPGDGEKGDVVIAGQTGPWERIKSWSEAWAWLGGNLEPGDTVIVLPPDSDGPLR